MKKTQKTEPDLLIESMQKLIEYSIQIMQSHMNDNKLHQEEIFQSLTPTDLQKILSNFEDKSLIMRKTSAAFLCELVYDNPIVQKGFCDLTNILPMDGKICVNRIPSILVSQIKYLPEIFEAIKNAPIPFDSEQNYPLCWYFENQRDKVWKKGVKYIKFEKNPQNAKQLIQNFIDPQSHLFGFIISQKKGNYNTLQQQDVEEVKSIAQSNTSSNTTNTITVRTQASKSTHEQKRQVLTNKLRPSSGVPQMNSVSPMIKRTRNLNTSVELDQSKYGKGEQLNLSVIDEVGNSQKQMGQKQVVRKPIGFQKKGK